MVWTIFPCTLKHAGLGTSWQKRKQEPQLILDLLEQSDLAYLIGQDFKTFKYPNLESESDYSGQNQFNQSMFFCQGAALTSSFSCLLNFL